MRAEILSTGDEVRTGAVVDSNAAHIAAALEGVGLTVIRHTCVGDRVDTIGEVLREIAARADVAVVTGGLGPTGDDVTAAAAARAAGVELAPDPAAMAVVERFFARRARSVSDTNRKQGFLPRGAVCLDNPVGTAPGFVLSLGRCRFFFLPGVPREMRRMLAEAVLPRITGDTAVGGQIRRVRVLTTFGMPESTVDDRLAGFAAHFADISLGLRAHFPEIHVRLYLAGTSATDLDRREAAAAAWVADRLGAAVVSARGLSLAQVVGAELIGRQATLALAESCTGGLVGSWITDVAGSSAYFHFGAVTYTNAAKQSILGVDPDTLRRRGAVDPQTALEMAVGARRLAGTTYGLATSGIAGPGGGSAAKPVGSLCIGVAGPDGARGVGYRLVFDDRLAHKRAFAATALNLLRIVLQDGLRPDLAARAMPLWARRLGTEDLAGGDGA
jgi:nicotinamide-nucleotide amidase